MNRKYLIGSGIASITAFIGALVSSYIGMMLNKPMLGFITILLFIIAICSFVIFLILLVTDSRNELSAIAGSHGSARFASQAEIKELTLKPGERLSPGSFFLSESQVGIVALPWRQALEHGVVRRFR